MGKLSSWWERQSSINQARPFLVDVNGKVGFSYGDANRMARSLADRLAELTGGKRHVVTMLHNNFGGVLWQVAIWLADAVHIPLSAESTPTQLGYLLPHSDAGIIVCDEGILDVALQARVPGTAVIAVDPGGGIVRVVPGEPGASASNIGNVLEQDPIGRGVPAAICYTSGSTGAPKGVIISDAGYLAGAVGHPARLGRTHADNVMTTVPLFHAAGAISAVGGAIAIGGRLTVAPRFSASNFWRWAGAASVTYALLLPTMLEILRRQPMTPEESDNPLQVAWSHLRDEELCARFGIEICAMWGLTETCGVGSLVPPGHVWTPGFVGWPFPEEASVVALRPSDGGVCARGEEGELWFGHSGVMLGYYKDSARTTETLRGSWVRTGDIGTVDEAGRIHYRGRIKNVIHRGGESIFAEELEAFLLRHPAVEECVAYGVPDGVVGQEVAIALSIARPQTGDTAIESWLRSHLERRLLPKYVSITCDPLPRLPNGKIDRMNIERCGIASAHVINR